jgi:hypothetical protein
VCTLDLILLLLLLLLLLLHAVAFCVTCGVWHAL